MEVNHGQADWTSVCDSSLFERAGEPGRASRPAGWTSEQSHQEGSEAPARRQRQDVFSAQHKYHFSAASMPKTLVRTDSNLREPMRRCKRLFELCMGVCSRVQGKRRKKRRSEKKKKKKRRLDLSWVGPAFKILQTIKSSGLYSLRILTKG